jgi:hypothetical protein
MPEKVQPVARFTQTSLSIEAADIGFDLVPCSTSEP